MQPWALTVDRFLDHAARWSGQREIACAHAGEVRQRFGYAELRTRSNRLSGALLSLGLQPGDRVATLAWNTRHHLELYYAVMGCGLVCHTLNPRFTAAHLARIVNEAADRVLAVAGNLWPLLAELAPLCPTLEHIVWLDDEGHGDGECSGVGARWWSLEDLLASNGQPVAWGEFDEHAAAGLCYTSGTTGAPKGVLYTHRSNYLHTLRALQADAMAFTAADCVLAAVPMFHANGWGLPFACAAVGAKLVLPGRQTDGASLAHLLRAERVTVGVGVQTVWLAVAEVLEAEGSGPLPDLERVLIGGSSCPPALIARMERVLGARVQVSWGMTELSPLGVIAAPAAATLPEGAAGRPPMGLDLLLVDAQGTRLPDQHAAVGHLRVRGPSVLQRYYRAGADAVDAEGWFDTGDLARIAADGELTLCGRAKDLIKSGGEWINPAEIEAIAARLPGVRQVAVIAQPHPRWGERPILIVETAPDARLEPAALAAALRGQVADWWLPDAIIAVAAMPLAATGKIDKEALKRLHAAGSGPWS